MALSGVFKMWGVNDPEWRMFSRSKVICVPSRPRAN